MRSPLLRRFRIVFSTLIFICFILVFVDFKSLIPTRYTNILLYLQFVPSFLKFTALQSIAAGGFIAVILAQ